MDPITAYQACLPTLTQVAEAIRGTLEGLLDGVPRIDRITTRVKTVASFAGKASKIDPDSGALKYKCPLEEIQDQIGARIVVFYKSDVEPVIQRVLSEFQEVESLPKEHLAHSFGYEAHHLVCLIPPDIRANYKVPTTFFELQIITLFQYAWTQAGHDLGYKSRGELGYDDQRRMAWAAAQAWGADLIFDELWKKLEDPL